MEQSNAHFSEVYARYLPYIRKLTASFPLQHREDLVQEGLWGLYCASSTFDPARNVPFDAYAKLCVRRALLTSYRKLSRDDGHLPLEEHEAGISDYEPALDAAIAEREDRRAAFSAFRESLSPLEFQVLTLYLREHTYAQIAARLSMTEKAVDNAMVRIRRKMRQKLA